MTSNFSAEDLHHKNNAELITSMKQELNSVSQFLFPDSDIQTIQQCSSFKTDLRAYRIAKRILLKYIVKRKNFNRWMENMKEEYSNLLDEVTNNTISEEEYRQIGLSIKEHYQELPNKLYQQLHNIYLHLKEISKIEIKEIYRLIDMSTTDLDHVDLSDFIDPKQIEFETTTDAILDYMENSIVNKDIDLSIYTNPIAWENYPITTLEQLHYAMTLDHDFHIFQPGFQFGITTVAIPQAITVNPSQLRWLQTLPQLKELFIYGTKIDKSAIQQILNTEHLPNDTLCILVSDEENIEKTIIGSSLKQGSTLEAFYHRLRTTNSYIRGQLIGNDKWFNLTPVNDASHPDRKFLVQYNDGSHSYLTYHHFISTLKSNNYRYQPQEINSNQHRAASLHRNIQNHRQYQNHRNIQNRYQPQEINSNQHRAASLHRNIQDRRQYQDHRQYQNHRQYQHHRNIQNHRYNLNNNFKENNDCELDDLLDIIDCGATFIKEMFDIITD